MLFYKKDNCMYSYSSAEVVMIVSNIVLKIIQEVELCKFLKSHGIH